MSFDQAAQEVAQQPKTWLQMIYMAIVVIVVNVPIWIREIKKHKDFRAKNGQLVAIKETVDNTDTRTQKMDKALGIVKTKVEAQEQKCTDTVTRIEGGLLQHSNQILELAKNGAKKD